MLPPGRPPGCRPGGPALSPAPPGAAALVGREPRAAQTSAQTPHIPTLTSGPETPSPQPSEELALLSLAG